MIVECGALRFKSTTCRKTGGPCGPGLNLVQTLATPLNRASGVLSDDFALSGVAVVNDCGWSCPLAFRVTGQSAHVFGNIETDANLDELVRFANEFLDVGATSPAPAAKKFVSARNPVPLAIVSASAVCKAGTKSALRAPRAA